MGPDSLRMWWRQVLKGRQQQAAAAAAAAAGNAQSFRHVQHMDYGYDKCASSVSSKGGTKIIRPEHEGPRLQL